MSRSTQPWRELPPVIEIEPTNSCNLRCRMCHVSFMPDEPRPTLDPALIDQLKCLRGAYFIIGSGFEPMMHRNFSAIIRKITAMNGAIELISNGSLMSDENISALVDADLCQITFSFDGIRPGTYEYIRRRASYPDTLNAIMKLRQRFVGRETNFAINSTIMRRNLPEIAETVAFWDAADFDLLRIIAMVVRDNHPELIRESLYPVREEFHKELDAAALDVITHQRRLSLANPRFYKSPLAAQFPRNFCDGMVISDNHAARSTPDIRNDQLGAGPGMSFPCRSPWTFAKILPDGEVQLCYQFPIGNLRSQNFEEIWFGERAEAVRHRVAAERDLCDACDFYRFCLNRNGIDSDDKLFYLAGPLLAGADSIDFDRGTMVRTYEAPPILLETIETYNIVRFRGAYLGVPHAVGSIDLSQQDLAALPGLVTANSLHQVRRLIRNALAG